METSHGERKGLLALALCLGGILLAVLIELTIAQDQPGLMVGYLVFVSFQIAAFLVGISARHDALAKASCITSAILACGSVLLLA
jgi:hypothetical protein